MVSPVSILYKSIAGRYRPVRVADGPIPARYLVRLSLLTMTNPNQLCDVLLFVCSKIADETNLSSKLPVADRTREV